MRLDRMNWIDRIRLNYYHGNIDRFSNAKKLVAFAGLDSVVSQSGRFENKTGKISKRGSQLLRQALFLAANIARMNDDVLKQFYDKKRKGKL